MARELQSNDFELGQNPIFLSLVPGQACSRLRRTVERLHPGSDPKIDGSDQQRKEAEVRSPRR